MGVRSSSKKPTEDNHLRSAIQALAKEVQLLRQSQSAGETPLSVEAFAIARTWLGHIFPDGKNLLAYTLSDGKRSTREIGARVGVDQKTVSTWWRTWQRTHHIIEKAGTRGQFKAKFTVAELVAIYGKQPPGSPSEPPKAKSS